MKLTSKKMIVMGLLMASVNFTLVGCGNDGPAERAGEKVDQAIENSGEKMEEAGEKANEAIEESGDKLEETGENMKESVQ